MTRETRRRIWIASGLTGAMLLVMLLGLDEPLNRALEGLRESGFGEIWAKLAYRLGKAHYLLAPLALLLVLAWKKGHEQLKALGWAGVVAVAVSGIIAQVLKHIVNRPRPRMLGQAWESFQFSFDSALHSFPSGHSATAFALAAVLAGRYPRLAPLFFVLAGLIALGRVVGGSHYLSDIFGGALLGLMVGWGAAPLCRQWEKPVVERIRTSPALCGLVVLTLCTVLFLGGLGDMPLTDRDEGEYAASVAAMQRTGDYMTPTLNGQYYLEKPIALFWAVAGAEMIAGNGEGAARLPSALASLALVALLGFSVWRFTGRLGPAAVTALCLAFMPLMTLVGRACLTDAMLTLWTTGALLFFFRGTEAQAAEDGPWYLAAWLMLGLGFLTKGPVALAVTLPVAGIYLLLEGKLWAVLKRARLPWGILIFLAVNLPWFGYMFLTKGEEFWKGFFVSQNFRRFSEVLLGHGGGWVYYLPVILLGCFPFVIPGILGLAGVWRIRARQARSRDVMDRLRLLSALAFVVVILVFSLAATKQINYILPALPWLAILTGHHLWQWREGREMTVWEARIFWGGLAFLAGLFALALAAAPLALPMFWDKIQASIRPDSSEYALPAEAPWLILWPLLGSLAALATFLYPWWIRKRCNRPAQKAMSALLQSSMVFTAVIMLGLLPRVAGEMQTPAKVLAMEVMEALPQARAATYGLWKPSLLYYLDRDLPRFRLEDEAKSREFLAAQGSAVLISRVSLLPKLKAAQEFRELGRFGGYLLGGNQAALEAWNMKQGPGTGEKAGDN